MQSARAKFILSHIDRDLSAPLLSALNVITESVGHF